VIIISWTRDLKFKKKIFGKFSISRLQKMCFIAFKQGEIFGFGSDVAGVVFF